MKLNRVPKRESNVKKCFCHRDRGFQVTSDWVLFSTVGGCFYNVPFPVVTITVGFGLGGVETITTIKENNVDKDNSDSKDSVSEVFFHIGLPFWNTVEFHLGYHLMSFSSIDITKSVILGGNYTTDKNYSGGMTTIGVQVAF